MENIESIDKSEAGHSKITHADWESTFSTRRQEAGERAAQHRARLQKIAEASRSRPATPLGPQRRDHRPERVKAHRRSPEVATPKPETPTQPRKQALRQDFDLIALWSIIAPSTIAAVFAGVAMSGNHVPLPFALGFVFVWFAMTTGLALGVLKLLNTPQFTGLLRASAARRGMVAIFCALVAVLAVEVAHLSITALAAPTPKQVGETLKEVVPAVTPARGKAPRETSSTEIRKSVNAGSVHFQTTPDLIFPAANASRAAAPAEKDVVTLPAPVPGADLQEEPAPGPTAKAQSQRSKDQLLGRISAKGKFLAHRSSSKWSGGTKKAAPDTRNILEKIFTPVINSAGAKAQPPRVGTAAEDEGQISR